MARNLNAPEWQTIPPTIQEDIKNMLSSLNGDYYMALVDLKQTMLEGECYTMLAQLRNIEEELGVTIPYLVTV